MPPDLTWHWLPWSFLLGLTSKPLQADSALLGLGEMPDPGWGLSCTFMCCTFSSLFRACFFKEWSMPQPAALCDVAATPSSHIVPLQTPDSILPPSLHFMVFSACSQILSFLTSPAAFSTSQMASPISLPERLFSLNPHPPDPRAIHQG